MEYNYKGFIIIKNDYNYGRCKHVNYLFYNPDDCDEPMSSGESIQDCRAKIDELKSLVTIKEIIWLDYMTTQMQLKHWREIIAVPEHDQWRYGKIYFPVLKATWGASNFPPVNIIPLAEFTDYHCKIWLEQKANPFYKWNSMSNYLKK